MRKVFFHTFALFIFAGTYLGVIQPVYSATGNTGILGSPEHVILFTDRSLYVTGEGIFFTAALQSPENISGVSKTLYAELLTSDGVRIAGGKYPLEQSHCSGYLHVPSDIITGVYYFRAYTKWMRNSGPGEYTYLPLKIVNPEKPGLFKGTLATSSSGDSLFKSIEQNGPKNFSITTNRSAYKCGDSVLVTISYPEDTKQWPAWYCLSVAREGALQNSGSVKVTISDTNRRSYDFYPETRGISLTGRVREHFSNNPVPLAAVKLSILGNDRDFIPVSADSAGRFLISLPFIEGEREMFVVTDDVKGASPDILVDNDYCPVKIQLPLVHFALSKEESQAAYDMALNMQIRDHFMDKKQGVASPDSLHRTAFYGKPQSNILLDNYVQLPILEEYFHEFLPQVQIRKQDGRKHFQVLNKNAGSQPYEPLVLIDLIAVTDVDKILALPSENIARIEIVNGTYVKGDTRFGGIISIFSKKNDLAGIDLPSSGLFFNFDFYSACSGLQTDQTLHASGMPDTRNNLCWIPYLENRNRRKDQFAFLTSDTPGEYTIIWRGVIAGGRIIECALPILVR